MLMRNSLFHMTKFSQNTRFFLCLMSVLCYGALGKYTPESCASISNPILKHIPIGRTVILKKNDEFPSRVTTPHCRYIIKHDFDLKRKTILLPENTILVFDGGSLKNGILFLNNNCQIVGRGNFYITDSTSYAYRDVCANVTLEKKTGIVVEGKHDISISGITFNYSSIREASCDVSGIVCYGLRSHPVESVNITQCVFNNCGVVFWNNISNSKVYNCNFNGNTSSVFRNETCYDYEGKDRYSLKYNGWKCGKDNLFAHNNVENTCTTNVYPLMWCSGVDGLCIINNHFEVCTDLMYIYCGDGNVSLNNAYIGNNFILIKDRNQDKDALYAIQANGVSWSYPKEDDSNKIPYSSCIIDNNIIKCENINPGKNYYAIRCDVMDSVVVRNNFVDGFSSPVKVLNHRTRNGKTILSITKGVYFVNGNTFLNYYDMPISVPNTINTLYLYDNVFQGENNKNHFNIESFLQEFKNVRIKNNKFIDFEYLE